jgi:hypothetical protein
MISFSSLNREEGMPASPSPSPSTLYRDSILLTNHAIREMKKKNSFLPQKASNPAFHIIDGTSIHILPAKPRTRKILPALRTTPQDPAAPIRAHRSLLTHTAPRRAEPRAGHAEASLAAVVQVSRRAAVAGNAGNAAVSAPFRRLSPRAR